MLPIGFGLSMVREDSNVKREEDEEDDEDDDETESNGGEPADLGNETNRL